MRAIGVMAYVAARFYRWRWWGLGPGVRHGRAAESLAVEKSLTALRPGKMFDGVATASHFLPAPDSERPLHLLSHGPQ